VQLSDLISIIGILLAILAFINENERLFIWNKFSNTDKVVLVIGFIFINYLLFFEWFMENISFLDHFYFNKLPLPNTWAYFISIGALIWILYKIFISDFPKKNKNNVIAYYEFLAAKKEFALLYHLIKKYNTKSLLTNTEKNSKSELKLIHLIFKNRRFLEHTSAYNFDFFNSILNSNNADKDIIKNHVETQLFDSDSFFNNENLDAKESKSFIKLLRKTGKYSEFISRSLKNPIMDFKPILGLIFKYYKHDSDKSDTLIVKSLLTILKSNNTDALTNYTEKLIDEDIAPKKYLNIVKKIIDELCTITIPDNPDFKDEISLFCLRILAKNQQINKTAANEEIVNSTKKATNQFPKQLYEFYYGDNTDFSNLKNLINAIANE